MYKDPYRHYPNHGWSGTLTVWVLRTGRGTEYVVGENASPKPEQLRHVIARIGPIAYEEGQGIEKFQEQYGAAMKVHEELEAERQHEAHFKKLVEREVEARLPKPAPEPDSEASDGGGENG
jgi:hypothetical protein